MEDGLTKAGDLSLHLQPLVSACFLASIAADKFPDSPVLVTSATAPDVCVPTYVDPVISAFALVAQLMHHMT